MTDASPLWPARLHHLRYDSSDPEAMVRFHGRAFALEARPVRSKGAGPDATLLSNGERRVLIGHGEPGLPYYAFALENQAHLDRYRAHVQAKGLNTAPSPSPLFADGAFALHDPDGRRIVFGLPDKPASAPDALGGRLQHVVVATTQLERMADFYAGALGFLISDWVREEAGAATACFLRADQEHHSLAIFRAPEGGPEHHSFEVPSWNHIRDWADHMGDLGVRLWWGPGRHGVGNNLFFMVEDPDGNKAEISSELEIVPADVAPRQWPHGERALNLWGNAWMRS